MANIIALIDAIGVASLVTEDALTKRDKVLAALEDDRPIVIVYSDKNAIISIRVIRPEALKLGKQSQALYVKAYDELRGETRNFRVDSILLIQEAA